MKKQEIPQPLHKFFDIFRTLEYRHDYITVFDDFLSAMMNFFTAPNTNGFSTDRFNKYSVDERHRFGDLIQATISCFDEQIKGDNQWYDPFGDFYQLLASRGKQSSLGQFFTPPSVVDMMVFLQTDTELLEGKRIYDPACGSGRTLISFHVHHPKNYMYGADLDIMCCKMASLNLMIHGCQGEIVHRNSLIPDSFFSAWKINSLLTQTGLPSIVPVPMEQSIIMHIDKAQMQQPIQPPTLRQSNVPQTATQLQIFS